MPIPKCGVKNAAPSERIYALENLTSFLNLAGVPSGENPQFLFPWIEGLWIALWSDLIETGPFWVFSSSYLSSEVAFPRLFSP